MRDVHDLYRTFMYRRVNFISFILCKTFLNLWIQHLIKIVSCLLIYYISRKASSYEALDGAHSLSVY